MPSPVQTYQQEMHDNVGFFATWLPGDRLEIGDLGVLERGRFRKYSSLSELGIVAVVGDEGATQNLQYTSKSGTSVSVGGAAPIANVPGLSAEIKVEFGSQGAFLFHASKVRNQRLEERSKLTRSILSAYEKDQWKKEWYLVESVHHADCATVIVAEEGSAGLVLNAKADLSLGALPLADPSVHLSVTSTHGRMVQVLGERDLRPLYSCLRLKDPWFSEPAVTAVRGQLLDVDSPLIRPSIEELFRS